MEVLNIELSSFCDDTVELTILKDNKKMDIYVQLSDGDFRADLGCIIYDDFGNSLEGFNDYEIEEIIKEAESFNVFELEHLDFDYVLKVYNNKVILSKNNKKFINKESSSYQQEYLDIKTFDSVSEAKEYFQLFLKK